MTEEQQQPQSSEAESNNGSIQDILREHSFDGIQEYDNEVPKWMSGRFVACCLWGVAYLGYYMFGPRLNGPERYLAERTAIMEAQAAAGGGMPPEELLQQ